MIPTVAPAFAYPDFVAPTLTFTPARWLTVEASPESVKSFEARGRLASGLLVRQTSGIIERRFTLHFPWLDDADKQKLIDAGGFMETVGADTFAFKNVDGTIHVVRFADPALSAVRLNDARWRIGEITLVKG
jgi:hypothetical protein